MLVILCCAAAAHSLVTTWPSPPLGLAGPRGVRVRACAATPVFDGSETLEAASVLAQLKAHKVVGVYAVANSDGETLYVGTSRDVGRSLHAHVTAVPELVAGVRLMSFASHDRATMNKLRKEWIAALGYTPEGNGATGRTDSVWTESVLSASGEAAMAAAVAPIASPFEAAPAVAPKTEFLELTPENVDLVLEEVRPYLISDGGNVAVAGVDLETRSVRLVLQGACGSCPSSTVTMKMGIERVLKEKFEALGEVLDVTQLSAAEGGDPGEPPGFNCAEPRTTEATASARPLHVAPPPYTRHALSSEPARALVRYRVCTVPRRCGAAHRRPCLREAGGSDAGNHRPRRLHPRGLRRGLRRDARVQRPAQDQVRD